MKINNRLETTPAPVAPVAINAQVQEQRSFGIHDVSECKDVNDVMAFLNIGDYSCTSIPEVCSGYALIKDDYGHPVAITSDSYDLLQPTEAFAFLDAMAHQLDMKYTRAGFTHDGRRMFIEASYGETEVPSSEQKRKGDILNRKIVATTSFDGSFSTQIQTQLYRVWCSNGMASWIEDKTNRISVRHTKNQRNIMAQAIEQATGIKQIFVNLQSDINLLSKTRFTADQMKTATERYFKLQPEAEFNSSRIINQAEKMQAQFSHATLGTFGSTAWDAMNAFTAFKTHDKVYRETKATSRDENRFRSLSKPRDTKKFRNIITELAGV
jgi:phage/plasmid-like protein (TIGR03299 family)